MHLLLQSNFRFLLILRLLTFDSASSGLTSWALELSPLLFIKGSTMGPLINAAGLGKVHEWWANGGGDCDGGVE